MASLPWALGYHDDKSYVDQRSAQAFADATEILISATKARTEYTRKAQVMEALWHGSADLALRDASLAPVQHVRASCSGVADTILHLKRGLERAAAVYCTLGGNAKFGATKQPDAATLLAAMYNEADTKRGAFSAVLARAVLALDSKDVPADLNTVREMRAHNLLFGLQETDKRSWARSEVAYQALQMCWENAISHFNGFSEDVKELFSPETWSGILDDEKRAHENVVKVRKQTASLIEAAAMSIFDTSADKAVNDAAYNSSVAKQAYADYIARSSDCLLPLRALLRTTCASCRRSRWPPRRFAERNPMTATGRRH